MPPTPVVAQYLSFTSQGRAKNKSHSKTTVVLLPSFQSFI
jgi:hypothetical protein